MIPLDFPLYQREYTRYLNGEAVYRQKSLGVGGVGRGEGNIARSLTSQEGSLLPANIARFFLFLYSVHLDLKVRDSLGIDN